MKKKIVAIVEEATSVYHGMSKSDDFIQSLSELAEKCIAALKSGNKILLAGNGGSAADAQHLAAELVNRFMHERNAIAALALTTDTSILTSVGNDSGFDRIFSRQVEALGNRGDILILLSTSGTSTNILNAAATARKKGLITAGFTGMETNALTGLCDLVVHIPSQKTARIQEGHILAGHILCGLIETELLS
ncbi:MAG: SIS domain-containing protein [Bacteroidales bacterium]|nr:SIS domain-containing protein [Bacteroidales bacterium]